MLKNIFRLVIAGMIYFIPMDAFATHIRGGFIEIMADPVTTASCKIKLYLYSDVGSTVRIGSGEIDFGDGTLPVNLNNNEPDSSALFANNLLLSIFSISHVFPGPGNYTVNYREFNRNAGIQNINNSVNTPFYIETRIILDPFYGFDSTPHIMNFFPSSSPFGIPYLFSIVASDAEGDSLSYAETTPMTGKDQAAGSFFIPSYSVNNIIYSQMFTSNNTGDITWQQFSEEGEYVYAVRIDEWRKTPTGWTNMGYVIFDFMFYTFSSDNSPAIITGLTDTAFISGSRPIIPYRISDENGDSVKVRVYSVLNPLIHSDLDEAKFYPVPQTRTISIRDSASLRRNRPYKIVAVITENNFDQHHPFFIWFTDHPSSPMPPSGLKADFTDHNRIKISWKGDANNVAGYTVQRADTYNPEYIRIAALGNNDSSFTDKTIMGNRDYFYKVKAIGTSRSGISNVLKINSDELVDAVEPASEMEDIILYPNPAGSIIRIKNTRAFGSRMKITIYDITGRLKKIIEYDSAESGIPLTLDISELERGTHILILEGKGINHSEKFIKY
jgi:hypothetical protein